jgi:hypothetical protein
MKESALGLLNPAKTLAKAGQIASFAAKANKTTKVARQSVHVNRVDKRPATLHEKHDQKGEFEKHGVTKLPIPRSATQKRKSTAERPGAPIVDLATGCCARNETSLKPNQVLRTMNRGPVRDAANE